MDSLSGIIEPFEDSFLFEDLVLLHVDFPHVTLKVNESQHDVFFLNLSQCLEGGKKKVQKKVKRKKKKIILLMRDVDSENQNIVTRGSTKQNIHTIPFHFEAIN